MSEEHVDMRLVGKQVESLIADSRDMKRRMTSMEHRFSAIEGRFSALEGRMAAIEDRMTGMMDLLVRIASRIGAE